MWAVSHPVVRAVLEGRTSVGPGMVLEAESKAVGRVLPAANRLDQRLVAAAPHAGRLQPLVLGPLRSRGRREPPGRGPKAGRVQGRRPSESQQSLCDGA